MARISRREVLENFRTQSLLEATRKIIATQGFDAVTMERVAEAAGITKGAIYLYFSNKDQLILSAIEEIASEMLQEIEKRVDLEGAPWERLCQVVRAQMEIMERHQDLLRTLLLDRRLLRDSPRGKKSARLLKYRSRHEGRLQEILEEGIRQKIFYPVDASRAAFYVNEMTISTAQKRMLGLSRCSLEQDIQGLIDFIARLLREQKNRERAEVKI